MFIKAYKPCAQKNYHISTDTAFRARLDCTKTGDVIHKNSLGRNSMRRTRRIRFRLSRMDPLPGSIDCRQGVCGVVRFDCADGLERVIQRYAATTHTLKTPLSNHGSHANRRTTVRYFFLKTSVSIWIQKFRPNSTGKSDHTIYEEEVITFDYRPLSPCLVKPILGHA